VKVSVLKRWLYVVKDETFQPLHADLVVSLSYPKGYDRVPFLYGHPKLLPIGNSSIAVIDS